MMIATYINGYLCLTPEEMLQAQKGQDPAPSTDVSIGTVTSVSDTFGPAAMLSGSLTETSGNPAATPSEPSTTLNLLA